MVKLMQYSLTCRALGLESLMSSMPSKIKVRTYLRDSDKKDSGMKAITYLYIHHPSICTLGGPKVCCPIDNLLVITHWTLNFNTFSDLDLSNQNTHTWKSHLLLKFSINNSNRFMKLLYNTHLFLRITVPKLPTESHYLLFVLATC